MILNSRVTLEESHIKMRVEMASKREILFATLAVLGGFLISIIIGVMGPPVHLDKTISSFECVDGDFVWNPVNCTGTHLGSPGEELLVEITNMDKFDQEFVINAFLWNEKYKSLGIEEKLRFNVVMEGRETFDSEWQTISGKPGVYHERHISCSQGVPKCEGVTLIHQPHITFSHYRVSVKASGELSWVGNTDLQFKYVNAEFTTFELWFRLFFLILTALAGMVFTGHLRSVRMADWALEQKWTFVLLLALFMYNNPFFPFIILYHGLLPQLLNTIFIFGFLAVLLLFWLCLVDGYRKAQSNQRRKLFQFYGPKIGLVGLLWLFAVISYTMISMFEQDDPSYDTFTDVPGIKELLALYVSCFAIYITWFVYALVRAMIEIRDVAHLQFRFKFFVLVTLATLLVVAVGVFLGFVGPDQENAATFLIYFSTFNMYIYYLSYMYASPARGIQGDPDRIAMLESDGEDADEDFFQGGETNLVPLHSLHDSTRATV
eukprot:TRINITY_DN222_c0_g1_i1.p1 TRINITY_DN222_c0_g1~~TRINITY_DN222_c0_g1_i1.p1  ORF type:complete len:491 (-),score=89.84 TRINITY_DN222_c0_g1_i1:794-2266(-)